MEEQPMTKEELTAYWHGREYGETKLSDKIATLQYEAGVRDLKIQALESQVAALNATVVKLFNRGTA